MFRPASRCLLRSPAAAAAPRHLRQHGRRFISTESTAQKSRSWKGAALRWGLAAGAVYYYNTSTVFAEEPNLSLQLASDAKEDDPAALLPTLETVTAAKRKPAANPSQTPVALAAPPVSKHDQQQPTSTETLSATAVAAAAEPFPEEQQTDEAAHPTKLTAAELEEEAQFEGAFNPETGEINWDCPCLGGMAHGPCGEDFRTAFSCFVYSTEEPKGMDCIDKFKGMQDCFRLHPEIYGSELDEEEVDAQLNEHIASGDAEAALADLNTPSSPSSDIATKPTTQDQTPEGIAQKEQQPLETSDNEETPKQQ
ncbi:hypothetical protein AJ80_02408 [Polytolypa hystricis UAMH7299]|uniref:Mitochondrial intermembrane space import and assembly protein 40 n=1 Tax=Polytolypa hystricis (strain UAMH7299) TaxID=1447883 RepID=A0A2B7YQ83_POLH7|nr:hypothetical protein AJ80_02408 [Polytolypa hystricis UAMH7299]